MAAMIFGCAPQFGQSASRVLEFSDRPRFIYVNRGLSLMVLNNWVVESVDEVFSVRKLASSEA